MGILCCLPQVRFEGMSAALCHILTVLEALVRLGRPGMPERVEVTAGSNGTHHRDSDGPGPDEDSKHYAPYFSALDVRSKTWTDSAAEWFVSALKQSLGSSFYVVLETNPPHFHIQLRKGMHYAPDLFTEPTE